VGEAGGHRSEPKASGGADSARARFFSMRRPNFWLRGLLLLSVLFFLIQAFVLTWLAPRYVMRTIERLVGGKMSIGGVRVSFPLTTTLKELRSVHHSPESAFSIQRTVIQPQWLSLTSRTLWVETLEIERPVLRLTRTKPGTILWPPLPQAGGTDDVQRSLAPPPVPAARPLWRVHIGSVRIVDGTVVFTDETPSPPFSCVLDHLSVVLGPVTIPTSTLHASFAIRGELIGYGGHAAPLYCSGWFDLSLRELGASCRLEPLALAAFEPYYHGTPEVRVYTTTIASTSRWAAKSNLLEGRVQLKLDNFSEGDLSVRGRTIFDVKRITEGRTREVRGEIDLRGPMDDMRDWRAQILPGDEQVQQVMKRLRNRGVNVIRVPLFGNSLRVNLAAATPETMTDIEAASKEIHEALEILALPVPEEVPVPTQAPAAEPPVAIPSR